MIICVYISIISCPGLPVESAEKGCLQPIIHQLLSPDHSCTDPKPYYVQARQAAQRSVRTPIGEENGTASLNAQITFYLCVLLE